LTSFPLCFFHLSSIILASSVINKRVAVFPVEYFLGIFGTVLIFISLEEVVSAGEVSERSIDLMKVQLRLVTHFESWLLKYRVRKPEPYLEALFS
jgi:hypothetical protein